jgi:hypothetical protein
MPPPNPPPPRTLWIGFGDLFGHAKPCLYCLLPVQALSGDVLLRATFALDSLELAARYFEMRAACLWRVSLRSLSFGSTGACGAIAQRATAQRPQTGKRQSISVLCARQSLHQNASLTCCHFDLNKDAIRCARPLQLRPIRGKNGPRSACCACCNMGRCLGIDAQQALRGPFICVG